MYMADEPKMYLEKVSVDDLVHGYRFSDDAYICLYCGERFETGLIHPSGERLMTAERAVEEHIGSVHGGPFRALAALGDESSGLPEVQGRVLRLLYEGNDDAAIARELGGKSNSTVRNHRFALRRREAEAKVFLALMRLLDEAGRGAGRFVDYPAGMPGQDERAAITPEEAASVEARYLRANADRPSIAAWPRKQKEKLVLLRRIAGLFEPGRRYSETEVNEVLGPVWYDYVTIRRYLIEYRFLERKPDGSEYWRR
jgi:DNA-binding CsgD family transcriptional regulator